MTEQSPITGLEPKDLIEISSDYTPINFPSRKNSFTTDIDDVPTVAASDIAEIFKEGQLTSPLFTQEREVSANPSSVSVFSASSSKRQPTAASIIECHKTLAKRLMLEVAGNCKEVMSFLQALNGHC